MTIVTTPDSKYTFLVASNHLSILRYGDLWLDLSGTKGEHAVATLAHALLEQQAANDLLRETSPTPAQAAAVLGYLANIADRAHGLTPTPYHAVEKDEGLAALRALAALPAAL